jgi:eukaryotic-like serine/threonine-protein kinase
MNPSAGTVLSERYALTAFIAAGGMGEVWAATDTVLGRTVAVKLLSPALSQQRGFLERFRAEARYCAALHHPNITTVFDYGEDAGSVYLVMELVAGQPLSQIISERSPMSAQTTASILIQAANALEAAHQGGVVHRDVKPANILITPDGTAKLTDFGISRLVNTAPLTQTGQILGTAQYLSPEQAMGQSATPSSDIYALGVIGHEMLTGQPPFNAHTQVATAVAHLNQPPPPLPETVPLGIRNVISAALAKDPAKRPATAAEVAHALGMPDAGFTSGAAGARGPALVVPAWSARTQAVPVLASPASTQAMAPRAMATDPPGIPGRGSLFRPAWVLAGAAAGAFLVLAAFALPDSGGSTLPSVVTATSPTQNQNSATQSTTPQIASPSKDSYMPSQPSTPKAATRGHHQKKVGKQ